MNEPIEKEFEVSAKIEIGKSLHELERKMDKFIENNSLRKKTIIYKGVKYSRDKIKIKYLFGDDYV